jgi:hypothetical protein
VDAHEPEEAIAWCERLLESGLRGRCLKSAATHWYRQDAVAAEVWLQQSPLDEEARRAVRTPPSKRPRKQGGVRPDDDAF